MHERTAEKRVGEKKSMTALYNISIECVCCD